MNKSNLTFFDSNQDFQIKDLKSLKFLDIKCNFLNNLGGITRVKSLLHLDLSNNFLIE